MTGLAGVNKKCGSSSASKGGGNLIAYVAGLAHAGNHNPALAGEDGCARGLEIAVDKGSQLTNRSSFHLYGTQP